MSERGRQAQVWLLFFYGFGNAATYSIARTIADSTYLSRIGTGRLPEVYLLSAGIVALAALAHSASSKRFGLRGTIVGTLLTFSSGSVLLALSMNRVPDSLAVLTTGYFFAQIRGSLGTIHFATVLNEQFTRQGVKRYVGVIGAGATIAGFSSGCMLGVLSDYWQVENFLYLAAFIDSMTILPFVYLRRFFPNQRSSITEKHAEVHDSGQSVIGWSRKVDRSGSRLVWMLASVVMLCIVAVTLIEFQWKVAAANVWGGDVVGMTKYFGFFYGTLYLITGVLQLTVTAWLLKGSRVLFAVAALPTILIFGSATAITTASQFSLFIALNVCKLGDALRRSLHDHAVQIAYFPLPRNVRRDAISFVSGVVKPFAEAFAAAAVVLLSPWLSAQSFLFLVAVVCLIWLAVTQILWRKTSTPLSGGEDSKAR
ncbi:MAG: hypothetical protein VXZ82_15435 [Planctomycetota bacterium]|nr:hypothetical protein [Planctomycetota bacterium]